MVSRFGPLALTLLSLCCAEEPPDAAGAPSSSPVIVNAQVDDKSKLYGLLGRWYPVREVQRLRDETLTAHDWCKKPPMRLTLLPDAVEVVCEKGESYSAPLARVRTSTAGEIVLSLRVSKDATMRQLRFQNVRGTKANITGSPCFEGEEEPHERFPDYEIMTRQILGGKRCSQIDAAEALLAPPAHP